MGEATVWVKPLNDYWQPIGTAEQRGVWHEGLNLVSDQWGPKSATFTLKRQPRAAFPDLLARTLVAVDVAGVRVWAGRIKDTPEQSGAARQITVQCIGGQAILDDDRLERILVHTKLGDWKDWRSFLAAPLGSGAACASGQVATDKAITLMFPGSTVVVNGAQAAVVLDAGPGQTISRVVWEYETSNNNNGTPQAQVQGVGMDDPAAGGAAIFWNGGALTTAGAGPTTTAATLASPKRYLMFRLIWVGAGTTTGDAWLRLNKITCFADTAYESGNASILDARTIILDALTRATTGLHPDRSGVGAPSFAFPNFAPDAPRTPRELIAAANAPISQWWFRVDEQLRPAYRARPTVPVIDLGAWLGSEGDNGSSNSDEGVVTKVTVRGQGADGTPVRSTRTQSGTIVDRQAGVAAVTLDTSYLLTQAFADQLGDAYLVSHRVSPFKGQNTVGLTGARRTTGGTLHPAHLLLLTGQLARRTDLVDPDTGALGRTAVLDQVTYRDDDGTSDLDLDNTRRDFEALQERLGLLVPA